MARWRKGGRGRDLAPHAAVWLAAAVFESGGAALFPTILLLHHPTLRLVALSPTIMAVPCRCWAYGALVLAVAGAAVFLAGVGASHT